MGALGRRDFLKFYLSEVMKDSEKSLADEFFWRSFVLEAVVVCIMLGVY